MVVMAAVATATTVTAVAVTAVAATAVAATAVAAASAAMVVMVVVTAAAVMAAAAAAGAGAAAGGGSDGGEDGGGDGGGSHGGGGGGCGGSLRQHTRRSVCARWDQGGRVRCVCGRASAHPSRREEVVDDGPKPGPHGGGNPPTSDVAGGRDPCLGPDRVGSGVGAAVEVVIDAIDEADGDEWRDAIVRRARGVAPDAK